MKHRLRRKVCAISSSRWAAYATAGTATAIAGATTAEADIHYSGTLNFAIPAQESVIHSFALDNNAKISFINLSSGTAGAPAPGGIALFRLMGAAVSNQFRGSAVGNFRYPDRLGNNVPVSGGVFNNFNANFFATLAYGAGFANSKFVTAGVGFIGFRFNGGSGIEYGWARVNMNGPTGNGFTLVDYAWADPGTPIRTGQISAVPEPSSLGLLAAGAAGLALWRKRRATAENS